MDQENVTAQRRRRIGLTAAGAIIGGLSHPLVMLAAHELGLMPPLHLDGAAIHEMWPIIALYLACGAGVGYLASRYLDYHDAIEHHKATQEILEELTLTVAHYIRNANSVIGGHGRRLIERNEVAENARTKLNLMLHASDQIEAVVSALQTLDASTGLEPIGKTRLRMLDIRDLVRAGMERNTRVHEHQTNSVPPR